MSRPSRGFLAAAVALVLLGAGVASYALLPPRKTGPSGVPWAGPPAGPGPDADGETETVDVTDYSPPKDDGIPLADDRVEDKVPAFDPGRVDRRPVQGWSVNASASVLKLDVPLLKPDQEPERLALHPSYAAAIKASVVGEVLPSVNLIDVKAKQFDDGLYAALDRAYYVGHGEAMKSHLGLIRRLHAKVAPGSGAAEYLAVGLVLAGDPGDFSPQARSLADEFRSREVLSKPISFYTWDKPLSDCFRVLRHFAQPIDGPVAREIGRVLGEDADLRRDYERAFRFYAGLTNPLVGRTPLDFIAGNPPGPPARVSLFPPSTSREVELFNRLFPLGLPADANLMRELILAIRSGKVDLKPREGSGWYDHQVYALETLLLPEKGEESAHLLLTRSYKKRMLQAFQALMTKRRETHARQLMPAGAMEPPAEAPRVGPRLRVEPNPTYYLRTARSYAFLAGFLESSLGEATLRSLKGLREGGERGMDLRSELGFMRDLFHGLYLLSSEDIGQAPALLDGEVVDREAAEKVALGWLAGRDSDPDLAVDTRVAVPIHHDPRTGAVRLWMTIGVRLDALDASYARPPSIRPPGEGSDWKPVNPHDLRPAYYRIAVDEFAEVELPGGRVLDRGELRATCDRMKTKEKIVGAFRK